MLLVKSSYRDGWEIPGGYVEHGASPLAAAVRKVREQFGADLEVTDVLVLDCTPHPAEGDQLLVICCDRTLTEADVAQLQLQTGRLPRPPSSRRPTARPHAQPSRPTRSRSRPPRQRTHLEHGRLAAVASSDSSPSSERRGCPLRTFLAHSNGLRPFRSVTRSPGVRMDPLRSQREGSTQVLSSAVAPKLDCRMVVKRR